MSQKNKKKKINLVGLLFPTVTVVGMIVGTVWYLSREIYTMSHQVEKNVDEKIEFLTNKLEQVHIHHTDLNTKFVQMHQKVNEIARELKVKELEYAILQDSVKILQDQFYDVNNGNRQLLSRIQRMETLRASGQFLYEIWFHLSNEERAELLSKSADSVKIKFRDYAKAESLYRHALKIYEKQLGSEHPDVAQTLNNLASVLQSQGKYTEAESLYRRALVILEEHLGVEHFEITKGLNNLALLLKAKGKFVDAEPLYRRVLKITEKQLGPDHYDFAQSLNNLASVLQAQGKYTEAESLYRLALAIAEKKWGSEELWIAINLDNLASVLQAQGKYAEAESLYRRALEIRSQLRFPDVLGLKPWEPGKSYYLAIARSLDNLASVLQAQSKYGNAESLYRRALEIRETQLGTEHPDIAQTLNNLASVLQAQGKYNDAEYLYRRALEIYEKQLGAEHPSTKAVRTYLQILLDEIKSKK